MGEIAKGALIALRHADRGLTAREIAIDILERHGVTVYDERPCVA